MSIPAIIYVVLSAMSVGIHLARDGEPRSENYSFFFSIFTTGIAFGLLYWGGFFAAVPK